MRHSVSIREDIGKEVEAVAEEEGLSVSEFYARAAEAHLERIRRRRAVDELDRRAGTIDLREDLDDVLGEMRRQDAERP